MDGCDAVQLPFEDNQSEPPFSEGHESVMKSFTKILDVSRLIAYRLPWFKRFQKYGYVREMRRT